MDNRYDVIVIGGGPAGMIAAGRAAELGAKVLLLEKNSTLGKKLLITGGGRCNVTNAELDVRKFLNKFKENKKFLFSPFSQHSVEDSISFFNYRGMKTKVEAEGRVFPVSDSAKSVWDVLVRYMKDGGVKVESGMEIIGLEKKDNQITGIKLRGGKIITADKYILATGGMSRPETGSTGDGFKWLEKIGHTIINPDPALVPIKIKEKWVHELSGVSLLDVQLTAWQNNKLQFKEKGKMLFTHFGISGPLVLNMSKNVSELLKYGSVTITLDLHSGIDLHDLDKQFQEKLKENLNKKIKNCFIDLVPSSFRTTILKLSGIDLEKEVNSLTKLERFVIVQMMKELPMTVSGILGSDKAIVTSGGVKLEEVDFKTMQSRLFPNLYLIGDILNIDRPSGGYSLQLCWTTGFVAGSNAAE